MPKGLGLAAAAGLTSALVTLSVISGGGQLMTMNVSGLARGVYALEVVAGRSRSYQKVVKQ